MYGIEEFKRNKAGKGATQAMRVMRYEFLHSALLDLISSVGVVTLEGDAFTAGTQ